VERTTEALFGIPDRSGEGELSRPRYNRASLPLTETPAAVASVHDALYPPGAGIAGGGQHHAEYLWLESERTDAVEADGRREPGALARAFRARLGLGRADVGRGSGSTRSRARTPIEGASSRLDASVAWLDSL
jgi:hypothetical protein